MQVLDHSPGGAAAPSPPLLPGLWFSCERLVGRRPSDVHSRNNSVPLLGISLILSLHILIRTPTFFKVLQLYHLV